MEQLALALGELGRDGDLDEHVQVAARPRPAQVRDALAAEPDLGLGLGPGLDLDILLTVDGGHGDVRAQRRLGDGDTSLIEELGALALEGRVRRDVDRHVEAAGLTAAWSDLALVGEPDLVPLVDPAGIVTRSVRLRSVRPSPLHVSQGVSTILPSPRQRGQALTLTIWPSIVWRTLRTSPRPSHWGHVTGSVPGLAPLPLQVSHGWRTRNSISFSVPLTASSNVIRKS